MFSEAPVQAWVRLLIDSERELQAPRLEQAQPENPRTNREPSRPVGGLSRWFWVSRERPTRKEQSC